MFFAWEQKTQLLIAVCTFVMPSTGSVGIACDMCPASKQTNCTPGCAAPRFTASLMLPALLPCASEEGTAGIVLVAAAASRPCAQQEPGSPASWWRHHCRQGRGRGDAWGNRWEPAAAPLPASRSQEPSQGATLTSRCTSGIGDPALPAAGGLHDLPAPGIL